ncbi:MAG TPA: site-specific integrase, partial [Pirellula sp.]|nr:site-specific integrase [Pirellula sp.]
MARPKSDAPRIQAHISGQSVVRINGQDYYLGKHGSPEAHARYAVLLSEYQKNGCKLPNGFDFKELGERADAFFSSPLLSVHQADEPLTVRHIAIAYCEHTEEYYADDPVMLGKSKRMCDELVKHYAMFLADSFGPVMLNEQRERWVNRGLAREYVNATTNLVFRMFKWATSREMVDATVLPRLKTLEPLRRGKTKARETDDRKPVPLEHVRKTAKHLSPTLKAMLRIHVACGMRPTELLMMRPCDIDRSGAEWMYRPAKHKNANKG